MISIKAINQKVYTEESSSVNEVSIMKRINAIAIITDIAVKAFINTAVHFFDWLYFVTIKILVAPPFKNIVY